MAVVFQSSSVSEPVLFVSACSLSDVNVGGCSLSHASSPSSLLQLHTPVPVLLSINCGLSQLLEMQILKLAMSMNMQIPSWQH